MVEGATTAAAAVAAATVAAAAANNNSILRYALPIQKQNIQNLSLDKETTSVDKEVTPRKLVSDQS